MVVSGVLVCAFFNHRYRIILLQDNHPNHITERWTYDTLHLTGHWGNRTALPGPRA